MPIHYLRSKILLLCCFFFPLTLSAQLLIDEGFSLLDTSQLHIVHTLRGDALSGRVTAIQDTVVFFQFKQDELVYSFRELTRIEVLGSKRYELHIQPQSSWVEMQGHENLLLSPTGFALPKGTFEYRNIEIVGNTIDVGLSDNFSVGAGTIISVLLTVRSKVAFSVAKNVHLGMGGSAFVSFFDNGVTGHLYGAFTFGQPDKFFNITAGSFIENNQNNFIATFGGASRISDRWRAMVDIIIVPNYRDVDGIIPTAGVGWFNQQHRIDFGLSVLGDHKLLALPFPYIAYGFRFGKIRGKRNGF